MDCSLLHVFEKVPKALEACIQALAKEHEESHRIIPGSGKHVLRAVSKEARNIVDSSIYSFTFHVEGLTETLHTELQKQISFLQRTKLSRLKLIILSGRISVKL